uniref:SEFIR domain-containing protein n=1 Tax=Anisakis simplex TaxID=6269 RepID=A0A0M3JXW2_ANISI
LIDYENDRTLLPEAVHDIRIEPFARAMPRRSKQNYQLSVDISWQMPPNNSTSLLKAFLLEIDTDQSLNNTSSTSTDTINHHTCFLFNLTDSQWTNEVITSSPRFHFSTDSIFEFGIAYDVILTSLPRSVTTKNGVKRRVTMPRHPANPQASKWAAGFRRIFVHSLARTIQIEFVGAPAHYCFEAYEVRLKDESGLDLLYSSIIPVQSMRSEVIDNNTVLFGEYNFTGLEVERDYVPSVIPIERADDGRCLCPVSGNNPFDNRVICSCIAADWKKVRLHRLERPTAPPMVAELNETIIEAKPRKENDTIWTVLLLGILMLAVLMLLLLIYTFYTFYHRYRAHSKTVQIRFIPNDHSSNQLTPLSFTQTPLIHNPHPSVLLVYTHDCAAHEASVLAFAEYLRDVFSFQVHLDVWEGDEIERNLMDYVSSSIVNADKVIILNSVGAYYRYRNKIEHEKRVERISHTLYDRLYETQIDQALMHRCVISVRFTYTSYSMVLPALNFSLQYILPDNIAPLISNLSDTDMKYDSRFYSYNAAQMKLNSAITRMSNLIASDPDWFQETHHIVPTMPASHLLPTALRTTQSEPTRTETAVTSDEELRNAERVGVIETSSSQIDSTYDSGNASRDVTATHNSSIITKPSTSLDFSVQQPVNRQQEEHELGSQSCAVSDHISDLDVANDNERDEDKEKPSRKVKRKPVGYSAKSRFISFTSPKRVEYKQLSMTTSPSSPLSPRLQALGSTGAVSTSRALVPNACDGDDMKALIPDKHYASDVQSTSTSTTSSENGACSCDDAVKKARENAVANGNVRIANDSGFITNSIVSNEEDIANHTDADQLFTKHQQTAHFNGTLKMSNNLNGLIPASTVNKSTLTREDCPDSGLILDKSGSVDVIAS